jgi:hypothetical protein
MGVLACTWLYQGLDCGSELYHHGIEPGIEVYMFRSFYYMARCSVRSCTVVDACCTRHMVRTSDVCQDCAATGRRVLVAHPG